MTTMLAEDQVCATAVRPALKGGTRGMRLAASPERVFRQLADIEALPQWAPDFCESVTVAEGGWVALTALGELHVAIDAAARTGIVVFHAGWDADVLHAVALRVGAGAEGGAQVTLLVPERVERDRARLVEAWREALRQWAERDDRAEGGEIGR